MGPVHMGRRKNEWPTNLVAGNCFNFAITLSSYALERNGESLALSCWGRIGRAEYGEYGRGPQMKSVKGKAATGENGDKGRDLRSWLCYNCGLQEPAEMGGNTCIQRLPYRWLVRGARPARAS